MIRRYVRNTMSLAIVALSAALLLASCSTGVTRAEFDKTLERYNEMVRWRELDRAALFAAPSIAGQFRGRVEDAKNARVIEYEVIDVQYDKEAREALATVTYKYYSLATGLVHDMKDTQKWKYLDEKDIKGWRLESLLPEFR